MLNLRIVQGPLRTHEDEAILSAYNRLTGSHVQLTEFRRWLQEGPDGPARHSILETDDSRIVGHACVIPLRAARSGNPIRVAKGEYLFLDEEFRKKRVRGFENLFSSSAMVMVDQLYRRCYDEGFGPILISAPHDAYAVLRLIGCRPADFACHECMVVLDPWRAARLTPNVTPWQRAVLFAVGVPQQLAWAAARSVVAGRNGVRVAPIEGNGILQDANRTNLFEDKASWRWRYPEDDYVQLASTLEPADYLIAKRGVERGFLRVCQWRLSGRDSIRPMLFALIRMAQEEGRLGVRWAVYRNGRDSRELLGLMRKLGFLSVSRVRKLLFYSKDTNAFTPDAWNITDSLFTFDY